MMERSHRNPQAAKDARSPLRNSVRLDQHALNKLLDERNNSTSGNDKSANRGYVRWSFRVPTLELKLIHPGRSESSVIVACRDLSAGGIGVLHSAFVHKGTQCVVRLPRVDGGHADVDGTVVRCQHIGGVIHEVGIRFGTAIEVRDFVKLDPFADGFVLEKVDPERLKGTVLFIAESPLEQSLVRHFLRQTQLTLIVSTSCEDALAKASAGVDLILCDYDRAANDGGAILSTLRHAGVSTPVIMLTADTSEETRTALICAQANAFIGKPLRQETLFRAVAEFMVMNDSQGGATSSLPPDHPNAGLLESFVSTIHTYADDLTAALEKSDVHKCRTLCLQIVGAAPVMGFDKLAAHAQCAESALSNGSFADAQPSIRTLIATCKRTTARTAA